MVDLVNLHRLKIEKGVGLPNSFNPLFHEMLSKMIQHKDKRTNFISIDEVGGKDQHMNGDLGEGQGVVD